MKSKINQLLRQWSKNTLAAAFWLEKHALYRQLAMHYTPVTVHESGRQLLSWDFGASGKDLGYKKGKAWPWEPLYCPKNFSKLLLTKNPEE